MFWDAVFISIVTKFVNEKVHYHKKWIGRNRVIWAMLNVEFVTMFGSSFLITINDTEKYFEGNLVMLSLLVFLEVHYLLGAWWVEDLIYGDMNCHIGFDSTCIRHNFGFYLAPCLTMPLLFFMQWNHGLDMIRGGYTEDILTWVNRLPLKWHVQDPERMMNNELAFQSWHAASAVYCLTTMIF